MAKHRYRIKLLFMTIRKANVKKMMAGYFNIIFNLPFHHFIMPHPSFYKLRPGLFKAKLRVKRYSLYL